MLRRKSPEQLQPSPALGPRGNISPRRAASELPALEVQEGLQGCKCRAPVHQATQEAEAWGLRWGLQGCAHPVAELPSWGPGLGAGRQQCVPGAGRGLVSCPRPRARGGHV